MTEVHKDITWKRIQEAIEEGNNIGFCINCGEEAFQIEPDAREYECWFCEESSVYGAEEILMQGLYHE